MAAYHIADCLLIITPFSFILLTVSRVSYGCKCCICDCSTVLLTLTMTPKRHASTKDLSSKPKKKKKKMMTISEKVKLLDMLKKGRSFGVNGVNESTVRYIKKDEANIRKTAAITVSTEA